MKINQAWKFRQRANIYWWENKSQRLYPGFTLLCLFKLMECDIHTFGYLLVLKSVHCNMCALWDLSDTVSQYFYRHRSRRKKSHDRIYWSHHSMAPPSQLTVHKQSSTSIFSLSIAPRWNHSTFANSMRYPLNLLSSNQAFSSPCLQLSTLTRKAVMLAWPGFWFLYIAWVWHNYVFFFGNGCDFCCFLFVFVLYIYIYVLQWWLISREGK